MHDILLQWLGFRTPSACIKAQGRRGAALVLRRGRGLVVAVRRGRVWLTEECDPADYVLDAGDHRTLRRGGSAVIECWMDADVELRTADGLRAVIVRNGGFTIGPCTTPSRSLLPPFTRPARTRAPRMRRTGQPQARILERAARR